jgi:hypothetical protein
VFVVEQYDQEKGNNPLSVRGVAVPFCVFVRSVFDLGQHLTSKLLKPGKTLPWTWPIPFQRMQQSTYPDVTCNSLD